MYRFLMVDFSTPSVVIDIVISFILILVGLFLICRKINRVFVYCFYATLSITFTLAYIFELKMLLYVALLILIVGSMLFFVINQGEYRYLILRNATLKSKKDKMQNTSTQDMYKMVAEAVKSFSKTKTGAIITFEKTQSLDNVIKNGTLVNAPVSSELLTTIFYPGTRLHDGAVVIRGNNILAASVYYTPTTRALTGKYGSRHRAAVGISEISDSVTVVVSEETGRISLAYKAKLESTTYNTFLDDLIDLMNDKD